MLIIVHKQVSELLYNEMSNNVERKCMIFLSYFESRDDYIMIIINYSNKISDSVSRDREEIN